LIAGLVSSLPVHAVVAFVDAARVAGRPGLNDDSHALHVGFNQVL